MDLFIFILAFLSQCFQTISLANAFSPQPFTHTSSTSYNRGRLAAADNDNDERKPWDIFRFVSQSSKFVTPPSLPFIGGGKKGTKRKIGPGETLWTPSSSQNFFNFAPLDDVVMGGASSSTIDNNTGIWTGTVTDANNGGFVGIRSTPFKNGVSLDVRNCAGVELRLRKGGGQRFKFVVRDSTEFNGICWSTEFDAVEKKGGVIRIPFAKQVPTIFGKTVSGKQFDDQNLAGFQLTYSKFAFDGQLNKNFQLGDFALQILELKLY
mmetsp:Transcript_22923/g.49592  ORF Transcript_22923/g.49592 Transcript_22923/m.49592 type:complete len:265 (+) Transcript_22923:153-947(+)|eukprot:CAMPEP_0172300308 /NCGR_PEP_ID=MMETSP1058-20130122/2419_1 /TAXON_ID=83371 /ORGANISM="Detonula confervacea, Strain CCMP 353" /LENGTH=264 /DNA_ID=CAMNT_0013010045 /DNA_START=133 /DNA_END=927 /DNA_ORIENTATION=+